MLPPAQPLPPNLWFYYHRVKSCIYSRIEIEISILKLKISNIVHFMQEWQKWKYLFNTIVEALSEFLPLSPNEGTITSIRPSASPSTPLDIESSPETLTGQILTIISRNIFRLLLTTFMNSHKSELWVYVIFAHWAFL